MRKALVGLLVLLLSVGLFAQESAVKGNLGGTVADATGAVVPKAKVTLTGPTGNMTTSTSWCPVIIPLRQSKPASKLWT